MHSTELNRIHNSFVSVYSQQCMPTLSGHGHLTVLYTLHATVTRC